MYGLAGKVSCSAGVVIGLVLAVYYTNSTLSIGMRALGVTQILFKNCQLFDGVTEHLQPAMQVLIENNRIKAVSAQNIRSRNAQVIDGKGKTLMPGLIDAHYHALAADLNIRRIDALSPYHVAQYARQFLENTLRRGFTTVRDAGGADFGLAQAIAEGLIQGPRLFYSGKALSQTGGHGDSRLPHEAHPALCACGLGSGTLSQIADGVAEVQRAAREELRKGASQIKIMASGGVASPSDPVWNLQYSAAEIRAIVWETQSWKTYVMAHAYTSESIRRCVELGVRSIEHGNLIDYETAGFCARQDAFVVPTLVAYQALHRDGKALGLPAISLAKLDDVRSAGLQALEHLHRAGVKIGFGTDLLGGLHQYQCEEFQIRNQVLPAATILRQATSINAELLNRSGELGVVAPGALADLLLIDGDPLADLAVFTADGRNIAVLMKDGKLLQ